MKLRSQTRREVKRWFSFPAEIRLMILETVAKQKHSGWASLASVCKEWQYVLEKVNFYKMKLQVSCLDEFESIASPQKRQLVHHVCLNVELPRYDERCCSTRGPRPAYPRPLTPGEIVSKGIWKLFSILSTWGPAKYLALELNVYSPSDCEHWFKNIYLSSDEVEHEDEHEVDGTPHIFGTSIQSEDPKHGWSYGRRTKVPPASAMQRLFRTTTLNFRKTLPQVTAVTCFIIRRQLRRCIEPSGIGKLVSKLDRLEHISYEPWAPYGKHGQFLHDYNIHFTLKVYFPKTLGSLTVFQENSAFYDLRTDQQLPNQNRIKRADPDKILARTLASKSLVLQHLAVSFSINAEELFRHCQSTWIWSRLQSLALTSQLLQHDLGKREKITVLLLQAGIVAQNMPQLHTFVLWNGGKAHACAFIYRIHQDVASITWRGTWLLGLSPQVVNLWQRVASNLLPSELQVKYEHIRGAIQSHGDAIYRLKLPCQVIEPASLWQIRRETCSWAE